MWAAMYGGFWRAREKWISSPRLNLERKGDGDDDNVRVSVISLQF